MINKKIRWFVFVCDLLVMMALVGYFLVKWHNLLAIGVTILVILVMGRQLIKEKQRESDEREYFAMFIAGYFAWVISFLGIFLFAGWEYYHMGKIGFLFKPIALTSGLSFVSLNFLFKARVWD